MISFFFVTENSGINPDLAVRKIGIPQVQRIVGRVYGPKIKVMTADDQVTFPVQQELIICTLLLMLQKKPAKEINFGQVRFLLMITNLPLGYL